VKVRLRGLVALTVVALVGVGCSSSSNKSGQTAGSSAQRSQTLTIGSLADLTGLDASASASGALGVQAGLRLASREGYHLKVVTADTQTSPSGALAGAQKLVEQDHVLAVLAGSAVTFAAAPYLTSQHMPVVGIASDGPEWVTSLNMFGITGTNNPSAVATTTGQFFKDQGATNIGSLGYGLTLSADAATGVAKSAQAVGLKVGYLNTKFPLGGTNVEPVAIAMKDAGVDGVTAAVEPNTGLALISALRTGGATAKVPLLDTGYGGDLLQAGPGAAQAAQGVFFSLSMEPVEMNTSATRQFLSDLRAVGVKGDPTFAEYTAYASIALLVQGLHGAGSNPTSGSLLQALSQIHSFDAAGLYGAHPIDINDRTLIPTCSWYTKFVGTSFQLVAGAEPLCGQVIAGAPSQSS
jgi:branched-chain amino acid transport system substrate-binding protein